MENVWLTVVGVLIVLGLGAFLAVLTCKTKHNDLFRWIGIVLLITFLLTWVLPYGYFNGSEFTEYGLNRLGLSNIPDIASNAVYFCLSTMVFLLVLGGFYGVVSNTDSYKKLVSNFSKIVEKRKMLWSTITMVLLILLTSILKSPLVLFVFLPFLASVFLNANTDKLTTMGITFGSVLVGLLGATWGTDGLFYFNQYLGIADNTGVGMRAIIGGVAMVLFVLFNIFRLQDIKKQEAPKKKGKKAEVVEEVKDESLFAVEETKNGRSWKAAALLYVLLAFVILAFFDWSTNLGFEGFNNLHSSILELKFGEDFTIFNYLLGSTSTAFGVMEIPALITILLVFSAIYALMEQVSLNDYMKSFGEGFVKMVKPTALYVLTYAVFVIMYLSPFMAFVHNWATGLTSDFNPFIVTVLSFIENIFHADLGYTGYLVGGALQSLYSSDFTLIHTIYMTTYGFVQLFMPTGGLLLVGLAYFKLNYKEWFKYIWLFIVAMFVVLLILATVVTYIM